MVRFRISNHKLSVETGRWHNVEYDDRKCPLCTSDSLGDEYHYLLECSFFKSLRHKYINPFYYKRPNMLKFKALLTNQESTCLINPSLFMGIIMKQFA